MLEDVPYALRQFRKAPGFTLTAIVSLALGIGANTAIFSVVNAVLRHPAGVDDPERVAVLSTRYTQFNLDVAVVSVPDLGDALALKDVEAGALEKDASFNTMRGAEAQHVSGAQVTWPWFQVFGAKPILGRTFSREEDLPGAGSLAVISYAFWQSNFGGEQEVIGKTLLLDGKPFRVIGVMRSDFDWPRAKQVWTPLALPRSAYSAKNRFNENFQAYLRLRPGVTVERLNAGLAQMKVQLRREGTSPFAQHAGWSVYATHLTDYAAGPLRKALFVLFGVVALVLLIAAANVAGLFAARASARSKEFAIRMALGASAGRMVRHSLVEALLLAGAAVVIGVAGGPALGRLLLRLVPGSLAEGFEVEMQPAVLWFTAAAGLLTSIIAGVGPAIKTLRSRGRLQLHESGRSNTASVEKQRLRSAFVIGEVALAFVLLTGTGLFLASLRQLQQVNPGFNAHGVLAGELFFSGDEYRNNAARQATFVDAVLENLAAQAGVRSAAAMDPVPFSGRNGSSSFEVEEHPAGKNDPGPHSQISLGTANLLQVMQLPLLSGRWLTAADGSKTQPVVVVDARLAHRYWPNENPVGQHLRMDDHGPWSTVVGVVGSIRSSSLETDTSDGMRYYAWAQSGDTEADFVVRANGDPERLRVAMRNAVASADRTQTLSDVVLLDALVSNSLAGRQLIVWMLAAFAGLALLLAVIGIYGLISYVTAQRTTELGIRMALGALRSDVVGMVLKSASVWVMIGSVIGIALSVATTTLLEHFFVNFGTGEAFSLGIALVALLVFGAAAGLIPACRAASVNPIQALRNE